MEGVDAAAEDGLGLVVEVVGGAWACVCRGGFIRIWIDLCVSEHFRIPRRTRIRTYARTKEALAAAQRPRAQGRQGLQDAVDLLVPAALARPHPLRPLLGDLRGVVELAAEPSVEVGGFWSWRGRG